MSKRREYIFTWNNYETHDPQAWDKVLAEEVQFGVFAKEVGESGTPHIQGYFYFKNPRAMAPMVKRYKGIHFEPFVKGTPAQNLAYIQGPYQSPTDSTKSKPFNPDAVVIGTCPEQGKRTDLDDVVQRVIRGEVSVDDLVEEAPTLVHQYGRTLDRAEDIRMRRVWRTEMTTCDWIIGKTESGKSTYAFKDYNPETHYKWKYDSGWQDDYRQQPIVVINEFRGQIKYSDLLELIDKFPCEVRRRNRPPMPFVSKHIIITSPLTPEELYHNLSANDSLAQLLRRISIKTLDKDYNLIPFIKK